MSMKVYFEIPSPQDDDRKPEKPGYNALMHEVCVNHGWCGSVVNDQPRHVNMFIPESGPVTADQFVDWLFLAEGIDPSENMPRWQPHKTALREIFIRHMGADVVDACKLKWDFS
ncbi:hypothetical protein UAJ10_17885 [Nitrospirillum sp. BR 11164]|uniref:hypothetical protein n=1 Tax=Nitrospirillum sp. BR 11164 TaxID=3104324 RepID=UPI002AFF57AC|nr:hypothetical protein [Nitrospirillum sp. BR 11164]MEA1650879.1 hypothetical protein [Nitrospirillum sp. BR 11164]